MDMLHCRGAGRTTLEDQTRHVDAKVLAPVIKVSYSQIENSLWELCKRDKLSQSLVSVQMNRSEQPAGASRKIAANLVFDTQQAILSFHSSILYIDDKHYPR